MKFLRKSGAPAEESAWRDASRIAAAMLLAAAVFAVLDLKPQERLPVVGAAAPRFLGTLVTGDSQIRALEDYTGQAVLLNVWATWCGPCREEMPGLQRLHSEWHERGLRIVAISLDSPGERRTVQRFVAENGLTFDVLYGSAAKLRRTYGAIGIPVSYLIDRSGIIRERIIGSRDWDRPAERELVESLLRDGR
jgi:peroxiredoxin